MVAHRLTLALSLAMLVAVAAWGASQESAPRASAGPPPTVVSVVPAALNADRGVAMEVQIAVADVPDLGGYEFTLAYDEAVLPHVYASNADFLGSVGSNVICLPAIYLEGEVRLGCVTMGGPPAPSGSGVLASVIFTTSCAGGSTALTLTGELAGPEGDPIAFQAEDGSVSLNVDPCADPDPDSELDGCTNGQETGMDEATGGLRSPANFWDFFDTPNASNVRDRAVASADFNRVLQRFGANDTGPGTFNRFDDPLSAPNAFVSGAHRENYHPAFDRGQSNGPNPWNLNFPDGAIASTDFYAVLAQFGHNCN